MRIYTAGHSDRAFSAFVALLQKHGITLVADVRSWPFSRWCPHFNKTNFEKSLPMRYVWMGRTLGGRDEHITTAMFRRGIEELLRLAEKERVCVMCTERDPFPTKKRRGCHRYTKITPVLEAKGVRVIHI